MPRDTEQRDRTKIVKRQRRRRGSIKDAQLKLSLDADTLARFAAEGLRPFWAVDRGRNIQDMIAKDYDFVEKGRDDIVVGDAQKIAQENRVVEQTGVGPNGEPEYSYLMAVPIEFYEEDMQAEEEKLMNIDNQIRGGKAGDSKYHNVDSNLGGTKKQTIEYEP